MSSFDVCVMPAVRTDSGGGGMSRTLAREATNGVAPVKTLQFFSVFDLKVLLSAWSD